MVAGHEMPGMWHREFRPGGYGIIGRRRYRFGLGSFTKLGAATHTVPSGTDLVCAFSRHFMPGYHHVVPPGQRTCVLMLMNTVGRVLAPRSVS
jgi:hypothetical protein